MVFLRKTRGKIVDGAEKLGVVMAQYKTFELRDLFLTSERPAQAYRPRRGEQKDNIQWGQRKLGVELMSFLTFFCHNVPRPIVVYAGASPGHTFPLVASMFPEITWHLYDPRPLLKQTSEFIAACDLYGIPKGTINFFNEKFSEDVIRRQGYIGRDDVFFVSDVRTGNFNDTQSFVENENRIIAEMRLQESWVRLMRPVASSLKFRLRWSTNSELSRKYPDYRPSRFFEYLSGSIMFQPWVGRTSTETRLIVLRDDIDKTHIYDTLTYEQQMFYFNYVVRQTDRYLNPLTGDATTIDAPHGLLNDYDSTAEVFIIKSYLQRLGRQNLHGETLIISNALTIAINIVNIRSSDYVDLVKLRNDPRLIRPLVVEPVGD